MARRVGWLVGQGALLCLVLAVGGEARAECSAKGPRVKVELPTRPPSRFTVNFIRGDGLEHRSLTWDPYEDVPLTRLITLPGSQEWRVAVESEPFPVAAVGGTPVDYAWKTGDIPGCEFELTAAGAPDGKVRVEIAPSVALPVLSSALEHLATQPMTGASALSGSKRSLGPELGTVGVELLAAVGDVMVSKVKSVGLERVRAELEQKACQDLTLDSEMIPSDLVALLSTVWPTSTSGQRLLLPETCEAIDTLQMEQLASAGEAVARAMLQDGVQLAGYSLQASLETTLKAASPEFLRLPVFTLVDLGKTALSPEGIDDTAAQRVLASLGRQVKDKLATPQKAHECAVAVVVATVAECSRQDQCDPVLVEEILGKPADYFNLGTCKDHVDAVQTAFVNWGRAPAFVRAGLDIMRPPPDSTPRDAAVLAVGLVLDLVDLLVVGAPSDAVDEAKSARLLQASDAAREVLIGALRGEPKESLLAFARWLVDEGIEWIGGVKQQGDPSDVSALADKVAAFKNAGSKATANDLTDACEAFQELQQWPKAGCGASVRLAYATRSKESKTVVTAKRLERKQKRLVARLEEARETQLAPLRKLVAFGVFAQDIATAAKVEDAESRRDAQREAVRALSAATTARDGRGRELIVGLGGIVGTGVDVGTKLDSEDGYELSILQVSPGVTVERVMGERKVGWIAALSPVDLGAMLTDEGYDDSDEVDLRPEEVLRLSAAGGATLLWPDLPLVVGARVWVDPYEGEGEGETGVGAGLVVGFNVALFDFN